MTDFTPSVSAERSFHPGPFCAGLIVCLLASLIVPRSLSFLPGAAGLILMFYYIGTARRWIRPHMTETFFILAIAALSALSALWSVDPDFALERSGKTALTLLPSLCLIALCRAPDLTVKPRLIWILFGLHVTAALLLSAEMLFDMPFYRLVHDIPEVERVSLAKLNRHIVVLSLTWLPLLYGVWRSGSSFRQRLSAVILLTLSTICALSLTESQTAQAAFALSVVFYFLFPYKWKSAWIAMGVLITGLAIAAPWAIRPAFDALPKNATDYKIMRMASIPHRLEIWNFAATEALKHPVRGNGVEALRFMTSAEMMKYPGANHILHPHNAIMQIWVEFGLSGILLGCALILYLLYRSWQAPIYTRALFLALIVTCLGMSVTGYGLWQGWQLGLFAFVAALGLTVSRVQPSPS